MSRRGPVTPLTARPQRADKHSHTKLSSSVGPSATYVLLALASIYVIWGTTYLAIRYAIESIPPLLMMAMRHLLAGSILYSVTRLRGVPAPNLRDWKFPAIVGTILFLGGHGSLAWAEQRVPSGIAALLVATLPMWILLLARVSRTEEKFSARAIGGVVLGFIGVLVLFGPDAWHHNGELNLVSALAILFGNFLWAAGTIYMRKVTMPASSVMSAAMQMIAGGASLAIAGTFAGETSRLHFTAVSLQSWLSLAYLIVFGSIIAFTAYTWLHTVENPSRVATYAYVNPVVAVLVGWAIAREPVTAFTIVAMVIILIGVALVNSGTKQEHATETLEAEVAAD
jgi:drug/metabolite transporter (DMT)-like permease